MSEVAQQLSNHRKFVPVYHYLVLPVLLANTIWVAVDVFRGGFSVRGALDILVAFSLLALALFARVFPLGVQNRVIRNEERERMKKVLPAEAQGDINKFTAGQMVGLRFASDAELPALAKSVLTNGTSQEPIKKEIKNWRADHERI